MIKRIWLFAPLPSTSGTALWLQRMEWLQVTDVAVFVNGNTQTRFSVSNSKQKKLLSIAAQLHDIQITPHFVSWLRPSRQYMTDCARVMRPLCRDANVRSLLFDVEEPWTKTAKTEANAQLAVDNYWQFTDWPCDLGVTGIVSLPQSLKPVIAKCEYVIPQAYSTRKNSNTVYIGNDGIERTYIRPDRLPKVAHTNWRDFWQTFWGVPYWRKPMVMGLAAWNLNRPGNISETQAMQRAIETTESISASPTIDEVAYWSFAWIIQSKTRAAFVRQAAMKARKGIPQAESVPA
ncbi:MAG: hypothetical protein HC800_09355 [Phormidesmis sp. RL_2_1]|nr:hypothetical protein [Phormidesmis sp. RL_2_1]